MTAELKVILCWLGLALLCTFYACREAHAANEFDLYVDDVLTSQHDSLQDAIDAITNAGGAKYEIQIESGTYLEHGVVEDLRGTQTNTITITGLAGERPILSGAQSNMADGTATWTLVSGTCAGCYRADTILAPFRSVVFLADDTRLFSYETLADFSTNGTIAGKAFLDRPNTDLYIRLSDGSDPNGVAIFHPTSNGSGDDSVIEINRSAWVIVKGLELRYGGTGTVEVIDSENVTLQDLVVFGGVVGISLQGNTADTTVQLCQLDSYTDGTNWDFSGTDGQKSNVHMETTAIEFTGRDDNVAQYNEVDRWFNGINLRNPSTVTTAEYNRRAEVRYNHINDVIDDALEADGHCPRCRMYENYIQDAQTGLSLSPHFTPRNGDAFWIFRNRFETNKTVPDVDAPVTPKCYKIGSGVDTLRGSVDFGTEEVKFWNNECTTTQTGFRGTFGTSNGGHQNLEWYNNIFDSSGTGPLLRLTGLESDGNIMNGNLYNQDGAGNPFIDYNGTGDYGSLFAAIIGSGTTWEASGVEAAIAANKVDAGVALPSDLTDTVAASNGTLDRGAFESTTTVTVTSLLPAAGPTAGGTRVAISGTYFDTTTTFTLGGAAMTNVLILSPNRALATTPAGTGAATAVATKGAATGTLGCAFTYE